MLEIFEKFGTRDCYDGYEVGLVRPLAGKRHLGLTSALLLPCTQGHENQMDRFTTCHLTIVVPTNIEYISMTLIIMSVIFAMIAAVVYTYIRKRIKQVRFVSTCGTVCAHCAAARQRLLSFT